jgi:uncharacterized protein (DUF2141 family)
METGMTRTTSLIAAFALLLSAPAFAAGDSRIKLRFAGIAPQTGAIMASVFDSEEGYASGKPVRAIRIPVTGPQVSQTLEGLAPGAYAVKSFHDVDGDSRMALNPFGTPLEPFAFSNDAPANMGPPAWTATKFEAGAGTTVHTITFPKAAQ